MTNPIIGDPIVENLLKSHENNIIAGLGIDFKNRRRNKVAGYISKEFTLYDKYENKLTINIETNESLGNCPKYITIRETYYKQCYSTKIIRELNCTELPNDLIPIILQASTIFLDFNQGNLLHITGNAKNIYGNNANMIMKNKSLVTEITITGFVYIENGLPIRSNNEERSLYNPSLSYLLTEKNYNITNIESTISQLDSIVKITPTISTFNFITSLPISYKSGNILFWIFLL